ncbi:glycosyltransferase [Pluralibacter gergoviae]|uniref:glycosyltransferase n=1 Tax=Pluralibacter gergoviae TaxID=61647 RepID=UPI0009082A9D|nr:glycosyltransferase [Pluralibacter gergoviae]HDS1234505.1 glycosyltransferase [Pluralibacter gergoviae]HDS1239667.1 glycosyltransferase [Pluralibacter gergoviae]HDS1245388.1 glycosyltransferase [Pluralibacter gergoviae]HDS1250926.1 glycosyltransferase [Pluralibacter gergoviae]HDS1256182.1 glycosyltransferase [Pluralibacter gergoviae]
MSEELITVYIITHNRLDLLKRALNSVLSQSYDALEIIVVNDNSTDGTVEYIKSFENNSPKIVRFFTNEKNKGACYSRNVAILNATGKYITGLDDDDYFLPDRVKAFYDNRHLLNTHALLYTDSIWKTKKGLSSAKINKIFNSETNFSDLLAFNFIGNQIFTKTDILQKTLFDESMPAWQDLECWLNLLKDRKTTAKKIRYYTYIQDISHEHERISGSKISKIEYAYDKIIKKYTLNQKEIHLLNNHFCSYGFRKGSFALSSIILICKLKVSGVLIFLRNLKLLITA